MAEFCLDCFNKYVADKKYTEDEVILSIKNCLCESCSASNRKVVVNTQVYCTHCKHFKIEEDADGMILIPDRCKTCYFYDFEDSKPFSVRWRYEEK